jgi:3-oxoacyl-[acyl-carrier-protein] synthase III
MRLAIPPTVGISAIATYEPPWVLCNDWFHSMLPRKFVEHSGIVSRRISQEDEVTMGMRAVENLRKETHCSLGDCAAVVFVASSLVPPAVAGNSPNQNHILRKYSQIAARQFCRRLGLSALPVFSINWGCSGYSRAMEIVDRFVLPAVPLRPHQFVLVVTVNRTSKIVDFGCRQTAPVFGDMAQATLLARVDSEQHPVHFALVQATAEKRPVDGVFFDFHWRENVLVPTPDGGRRSLPRRLVFSLNMMGIADAAPRAMADATAAALQSAGISPEEVAFVVPHQAGAGIVRLTAMRLERLGIRGEVVNGLTRDVGNVSSSSVPYALKQNWSRLSGTIVCPTAGVGGPGQAQVSQGCVILQATRTHAVPCRAA